MQGKGQPSPSKGSAAPRGDKRTVIFVGHARLPQSLAGPDASPVVSVEVEADMATGTIVSATARGVLTLGAKFLEELLPGRNLKDGPQDAMDGVERRYVCPSRKTLCTAVANAYKAYYQHREQGAPNS